MIAVVVHPHARKHGLDDAEIRYAWNNYAESATRTKNSTEVRVGFTPDGREVEMLGTLTKDGWLVFHANSPVTKRVINEIRAIGGRR